MLTTINLPHGALADKFNDHPFVVENISGIKNMFLGIVQPIENFPNSGCLGNFKIDNFNNFFIFLNLKQKRTFSLKNHTITTVFTEVKIT